MHRPALALPRDPSNRSPRLSSRALIALGTAVAALVLILLVTVAGLSTWRGFGFRANRPELQRLRHVLALKPEMSVADVGAGNGELTVALAGEIASSGHVYSTDIDLESLERVRAAVRAAGAWKCHGRALAGRRHEAAANC